MRGSVFRGSSAKAGGSEVTDGEDGGLRVVGRVEKPIRETPGGGFCDLGLPKGG